MFDLYCIPLSQYVLINVSYDLLTLFYFSGMYITAGIESAQLSSLEAFNTPPNVILVVH